MNNCLATGIHNMLDVMEVLTMLYGMNGMMMDGMMAMRLTMMRCGLGETMMVGGMMVNIMMNGMNMNGPTKPPLPRKFKLPCHPTRKSDFKMLFKLSRLQNNWLQKLGALGKRPRKRPNN